MLFDLLVSSTDKVSKWVLVSSTGKVSDHYKKRGFLPRLKNAAIAPKNAAIGYSRVFYSRVYKRGLNTAARGL